MVYIKRNEKYFKQLQFLISFQNHNVVSLMGARGFDEETLNEGWKLLNDAGNWMFKIEKTISQSLIAKLNHWQNTWFEVSDAALSRLFPEIHEELFSNLNKTSGIEVIKTASKFIERIEEISNSENEKNKEAIQVLNKRGFSNDEIEEGKQLLKKANSDNDDDLPIIDPSLFEMKKKKENAMWAWYLDWTRTASTVVENEELKLIMGLVDIKITSSPIEDETHWTDD
jgi:hypothetical protein